jgi:hypothetical protein
LEFVKEFGQRDPSIELIFIEAADHGLKFDAVRGPHNDILVELRTAESLADVFKSALEFIVSDETTAEPVETVIRLSELDALLSLDLLSDALNHTFRVYELSEGLLQEIEGVTAHVPYCSLSLDLISQARLDW